jgi:hypothetical protein
MLYGWPHAAFKGYTSRRQLLYGTVMQKDETLEVSMEVTVCATRMPITSLNLFGHRSFSGFDPSPAGHGNARRRINDEDASMNATGWAESSNAAK